MKKEKRPRLIPYKPDPIQDPETQMRDNAHTPFVCTGQGNLDRQRREALAESKRRIAHNTIIPKKPQWRIWHKTGEK